jgi:hypothetical protein
MLRLGVFLSLTGHHVATGWHPGAQIDAGISLEHYVEITQIAERGKMDMVFFYVCVAVRNDNIEAFSRGRNSVLC